VVVGNGAARLKSISAALADAGAETVVVADQREGSDDALQISAADLYNPDTIRDLVDQIVERRGRIDILVNTAGLMRFKPFIEVSNTEWYEILEVNLLSSVLWSQAVGNQMIEQRRGRIINVISGLADRGLASGVACCAAEAATKSFTQALALEWARNGVRVNSVGIGWIGEEIAADRRLTRFIPLGRMGTEDDLGGAIVYLASDASDFVTGACFYVDGGLMAHG
jgi:NAD(P)-dependent dehydrogenase (short-subunit alcohol dehydrogenase family)